MFKLFETYIPIGEFEIADLSYIKDAIAHYGEALFDRHPAMHFSASAMIFNQEMTKTVLIFHKLYNSWGWVGGHMDAITDFKAVALKEAFEETGIKHLRLLKEDPVSIEVLPVWYHMKNGAAISSHLHLNVSYILIADEKETLTINELETNGVKWVMIADMGKYVSEPDILPIYKKIIERGIKHEKCTDI